MDSQLEVITHKNLFMLFSYLSAIDALPIRTELGEKAKIEFEKQVFSSPVGSRLPSSHSRYVAFTLSLTEELKEAYPAPDRKTGELVTEGKIILPYLQSFKSSTTFNGFYHQNLERYEKVCSQARENLSELRLHDLICDAWKTYSNEVKIVPIPLTSQQGFGHRLGKNSYAVIGYPFEGEIAFDISEKEYLWLYAIHEGSHPSARKAIEPLNEKILQMMPGKSQKGKVGNFEELFNIAVEAALIHPKVFSKRVRDAYISGANERFILLEIFYDAAIAYAKKDNGNLTDLAENILMKLNAKQ